MAALRRVENPPNPFQSAYREWLGPPPLVKLEIYEEQARTILSENDSPDIPFRFSVNPYRGCQHACAYCFARPTHEYLGLGAGTDFDSKIIVKVNAPRLLADALTWPRWKGDWIAFSGVTDCYQPVEAVYQLTRRCLQVCQRFGNAVGIVTKSYLIVRDIDVLTELNGCASARVYFSIPFADDATARKIEPGAPPTSKRFEAMQRLSAAGVPVGLIIAPLIPGLNDRDIPRLLQQAADCGAKTAYYGPLRLPGSVRPVFLTRMGRELPLAAERIENRIREMRGGAWSDPRFGHRMKASGPYWDGIRQLFEKTALRLGLNKEGPVRPRSKRPRPRTMQLTLFEPY